MHHLSHCPQCLIEGNAVEHVVMAGINVHDTHDALVHRNVVYNNVEALGGGGMHEYVAFYVEDGNEINNTLSQNVGICYKAGSCGTGIYIIGSIGHDGSN